MRAQGFRQGRGPPGEEVWRKKKICVLLSSARVYDERMIENKNVLKTLIRAGGRKSLYFFFSWRHQSENIYFNFDLFIFRKPAAAHIWIRLRAITVTVAGFRGADLAPDLTYFDHQMPCNYVFVLYQSCP